eukprot:jgi/Psemu1/13809/gm1.13809_g
MATTTSNSASSPWGRVARLSCIAAVAAINIATAPVVLAQKDKGGGENSGSSNSNALACMDKSGNSCMECLNDSSTGNLDEAGCGWAPGFGCLSSCSVIADTTCYSSERTGANTLDGTGAAICARADADLADEELCYAITDCTSCVSTLRSDGIRTCQWFGEVLGMENGSGWCGTDCTMIGCGSPSCPGDSDITIVSPDPPAETDVSLDSAGAESDASQASMGSSSSSSQPQPESPTGTESSSGSSDSSVAAATSETSPAAIGIYSSSSSSMLVLLLGLAPILAV